jgi:hypothetical protein
VSEKISRIKAHAQARTLKKATITADQLQRRYAFLSNALKADPRAGNPILTVAKWHAGLDPLVQATLERAEPLTWLKHLHAKRPGRVPRFPWHVTALLFEERVRAQARLAAMSMETIPEDILGGLDSPPLSKSSPEQAPFHRPASPQGPRDHLHPSLSRRRSYGDEGNVSFEPIVESSRKSLDDSRQSFLHSGIFSGSRSPSNSRIHLRDIASRVRRRGVESDEASSSHPSASEDNGRLTAPRKNRGARRHFFKSLELDLGSHTRIKADKKVAEEEDAPAERLGSPGTAMLELEEMRTPGLSDVFTPRPSDSSQAVLQRLNTSSTIGQNGSRRLDHLLRRSRTSVPLSPRGSWKDEEPVDEEAERMEYDRRAE